LITKQLFLNNLHQEWSIDLKLLVMLTNFYANLASFSRRSWNNKLKYIFTEVQIRQLRSQV